MAAFDWLCGVGTFDPHVGVGTLDAAGVGIFDATGVAAFDAAGVAALDTATGVCGTVGAAGGVGAFE